MNLYVVGVVWVNSGYLREGSELKLFGAHRSHTRCGHWSTCQRLGYSSFKLLGCSYVDFWKLKASRKETTGWMMNWVLNI